MLARVARGGWESPPPDARGFLGKARPPRVSRVLRGGRVGAPDGRQVDIPAPRAHVTSEAGTAPTGRAGFWTRPSGEAGRGGLNDPALRPASRGSGIANPTPRGP